MENDPFIDDFPIKTSIYKGFSMAMLNNQMVNLLLVSSPEMDNVGIDTHKWKPYKIPLSHPIQAASWL